MGETSLVLYEGMPLERIAAGAIVPYDTLKELVHSRFHIEGDVVIGDYGVTGFLIIDERPEKRWESYTDGNLWFVPHSTECGHLPEQAITDPFRRAHYLNTDLGFKMIRYFLLPPKIKEYFEKDQFIGEGLIRKCCEEGVPEFYDEERALRVFGALMAEPAEGERLVDGVVAGMRAHLEDIWKDERKNPYEVDFARHAYMSFHPGQHREDVVNFGKQSIMNVVGNFDRMIAMMDRGNSLQRQQLNREGNDCRFLALPSGQ